MAPLSQALARSGVGPFVRASFAEGLAAIGKSDEECASIIALQLTAFADQDPTLNGLLISSLLDVQADEHVGVIKQALDDGKVDESVAGDWEDVLVAHRRASAGP